MAEHRTPEEREAAMAVLEANGGNVKKTARETGVSPKTLREWKAGGKDVPPPEKSDALTQSYLEKARGVREALLDRLKELAPKELDMFKVAGAFKVLTDAVSEEEVNRALTERIRRGTAEALSAAGASGHGADRGDGEAGTGRNRATA